jgi:peptidoglycan/xylan/chitin deacetylase (PgdA/CDA1 family)
MISGPRSSRSIYLTFDDGPHPEHTPRLLDALAEHGIRATFFVIGREAERHPAIVRRIVAEGHEIGNHTWSHAPPGSQSIAALVEEVRKTRSLLEQLTGRPITLYRPPHGKLSAAALISLWQLRQRVVLWTVDWKDYDFTCSTDLDGRVETWTPASGQIVLLHDNRPWAACLVPTLATTIAKFNFDMRNISQSGASTRIGRDRST